LRPGQFQKEALDPYEETSNAELISALQFLRWTVPVPQDATNSLFIHILKFNFQIQIPTVDLYPYS
jgi:hypothetical protein